MAKHKKDTFCVSNMHDYNDAMQCRECGDYDPLFAPSEWWRAWHLGQERGPKYRKKQK